jgi:hypothetical protein
MRSLFVAWSVLFSCVALAGCGGPTPVPGEDAGPGVDGGHVDGGHEPGDDAGPEPIDAGPTIPDTGPEPCDSPGATETVSCGRCGTTDRFCTAAGVWAYGLCSDEGECAPGETRAGAACGNCGTQAERCSDACAWEADGACTGEGECAPGSTARSGEGCPAGQTRDVSCDDACTFAPAGECADDSCTMPGTVESVPCGTMCGTVSRFCTAAGTWSYGSCMETGVCVPGTTSPVACGDCGTRMARCTVACAWDDGGTCTGEGPCTPGETTRTDAGCPAGQTRALTCSDACAFEPGVCEVDECAPGATMMVACGMCGTRTRTCSAMRRWVDGACTGEGVCMPGTTGTQACGLCGTQATRCTTACAWEPSAVCGGEMTCPRPPSTCISATTLRSYVGAPTSSAGTCSYTTTDVTCAGGCSAGMCTGGTTLLRGLGGPAGFGTGTLVVSDDGSSAAIPITTPFPAGLNFYGVTHTSVFVNNNGNVSLGAALSTFTPMFPRTGTPVLAPWWGDVDTRGDMRPTRNNVHWFTDASRLIVTWHRVGYYAMHNDLENSFQMIITRASGPGTAPGDFDVELRYEQCQWTTGDASSGMGGLGGTPAAAGFDSGTGPHLALPGSGTAAVLDLCTGSNVGSPGLRRYRFRGGVPI